MKALAAVLVAAGLALAACGGSSGGGPIVPTGGSSPSGSGSPGMPTGSSPSGGGSQPMAASPPNLAALPGGSTHLTPLAQHGPKPDACKVLTTAMVLALIPGAGKDGKVTTPRSDTQGGATVVTCQYLATSKASGTGVGNIIITFAQAGLFDAQVNKTTFENFKTSARGKPNFRDYGAALGANSLAYFDGFELKVLYKGQPFSVSASGKTVGGDQDKWRDDVDVPVARNIIARMNG